MLSLNFFSYTRHQFVYYLRFLAKWPRDLSRDLLTQYLYFKNVKDEEFFMCGKLLFTSIIFADVIANKSFSKGTPNRPMENRKGMTYLILQRLG